MSYKKLEMRICKIYRINRLSKIKSYTEYDVLVTLAKYKRRKLTLKPGAVKVMRAYLRGDYNV